MKPDGVLERVSAFVPSIVALIAGSCLFIAGSRLPPYWNDDWAERFLAAEITPRNSDQLSAEWYAAKRAAETNRVPMMDAGLGIAGLGISFALLLAAQRSKRLKDVAYLSTPERRSTFVWLCVSVWLSLIPAEWAWLMHTLQRGDYPTWADSIGIPLGGTVITVLIGLPFIAGAALLATRRSTLPAILWRRPAIPRPRWLAAVTVVSAGACVVLVVSEILAEPFLVPFAFFSLYCLLSARAAMASRADA